ncbi:MAG: O-antigen translocase [Flavobacteriaceae bacterium]|jgi:O-antigen/teichoic acid export membrane protein|nr:O-antigen translocase [Flavobacteriaceae bacterium]MDG1384378.1 O-antigen translocase [Flavobacteriaceae bacterium]
MMLKKLLKHFKKSILLKIVSLNSLVTGFRLVIAIVIQKLLAELVGASGIAKIGQLRNLMVILTSTSSLGVFNGVVKYTSELKKEEELLAKFFSTTFIFSILGTVISTIILFIFSNWISIQLFGSDTFEFIIIIAAFVVPAISLNRIFSGVVNGLSAYKQYAKIELIAYLTSSVLLLYGLFNYNINGVLIAIAIAPIVQLLVLLFVFGSVLKTQIKLKGLSLHSSFTRALLTFAAMSFISTVLINYIEIDIRSQITNQISSNQAGYWTAILIISKNYMVFSTGLFTLYVIPRFAEIYSAQDFKNEVFYIYKTILPLFAVGMILIYIFRMLIIDVIYPGFYGMEPLFKWQLAADFVRLSALVLAHQFLAKKMLISYVLTEFISIILFYIFSKLLLDSHGIEGIVMAHLLRYIVYFIVVIIAIWYHFKNNKNSTPPSGLDLL